MRKKWMGIISLVALLIATLFIPLNFIERYVGACDNELLVIKRKSLLIEYGVYITSGKFNSKFSLPDSYIKPYYIGDGFSKGEIDIIVEFECESITVYPFGYYESTNLNRGLKVETVRNTGNKTWEMLLDKADNRLHLKIQ